MHHLQSRVNLMIGNLAVQFRPEIDQRYAQDGANLPVYAKAHTAAFNRQRHSLLRMAYLFSDSPERFLLLEQQTFSIDNILTFIYTFSHLRDLFIMLSFDTSKFIPLAVDAGSNTGEVKLDKLFAAFKIDYWYHVFVILGCVGIIAALIFDFKGIANKDALLLFSGIMLIGIGEWINHPLQTSIVPPNVYTPGGGIITGHPRQNVFLGVLFEIGGFALCALAFYKIYNAV